MAIRVALEHRTTYTYDKMINVGPQVAPAALCAYAHADRQLFAAGFAW